MTSPTIRQPRRIGRTIAMGLALICGTAVGVTTFDSPAYAQKKAKASKGFVKVYGPVSELAKGDAASLETAKQKIPEVVGAIKNNTDKNAAGGVIYNIGVKTSDQSLQLQGINLMLESGQLEPEKVGKFNWGSYQLSRNAGNAEGARSAIDGVIAAGYTPQVTLSDGSSRVFAEDNLRLLAAETFVDDDDYAGALAYLKNTIANSEAAGNVPPKLWISRGVDIAYNNELVSDMVQFSTILVGHYPSTDAWRDAINRQRNLILYEDLEMLDLLRLAAIKGTLDTERDYIDYADAADVLRKPTEVKRILEAGIAAGVLDRSNSFITEALASAKRRASGEAADLASLENDAKKSGASAKLATTSGDAYLSQGNAAKAEEMYNVALQRPGVDEATVNTHLGMAQVAQGKKAEAVASFAKVQGQRKPIAMMWAVHAEE